MSSKNWLKRILWFFVAIFFYLLFTKYIPHKYINRLPTFFYLSFSFIITLGILMSIGNYRSVWKIRDPDTNTQVILSFLSFFIFPFLVYVLINNFDERTDRLLESNFIYYEARVKNKYKAPTLRYRYHIRSNKWIVLQYKHNNIPYQKRIESDKYYGIFEEGDRVKIKISNENPEVIEVFWDERHCRKEILKKKMQKRFKDKLP